MWDNLQFSGDGNGRRFSTKKYKVYRCSFYFGANFPAGIVFTFIR